MSSGEHTCCNLNIQRDLYSAFLVGSVVENNKVEGKASFFLDTADVIKRWRSMEAVLQQAVSYKQVASGRQLPSNFGYIPRDRAARLRSSDADGAKTKSLHERIPLAKNRDVVAVQLELF